MRRRRKRRMSMIMRKRRRKRRRRTRTRRMTRTRWKRRWPDDPEENFVQGKEQWRNFQESEMTSV